VEDGRRTDGLALLADELRQLSSAVAALIDVAR
jgi:hypothetical protein